MEFKELAKALWQRRESYLPYLFPAGKKVGNYFLIGNVQGDAGDSLAIPFRGSVGLRDFSGDFSGDDLGLWAAARCNGNIIEAAKEVKGYLGILGGSVAQKTVTKPVEFEWIMPPVPADPDFLSRGNPDHIAEFKNQAGQIEFYVRRWNATANKKKQHIPLSWGNLDGKLGWYPKIKPSNRPLYGLFDLITKPTSTVIVVEGEVKRDKLAAVMDKQVVVSWTGGAKAIKQTDWKPLAGRTVFLWPDNDDAGLKAMAEVAAICGAKTVKTLKNPDDKPQGWDAADAIADGWGKAEILAWIKGQSAAPKPVVVPPVDDMPEFAPVEQDAPVTRRNKPEYKGIDIDAPDNSTPFIPLGYNGAMVWYFSKPAKQVIQISLTQHTKSHLLWLAPPDWWEERFYSKKGIDWDRVVPWLYSISRAAGAYNPNKRRGLGYWEDMGRSVVHLGDRLLVDGTETVKLGDLTTSYIYELRPTTLGIGNDCLTPEQLRLIPELAGKLGWARKYDHMLLSGWIVCAYLSGALSWRPHFWVTGASNTGKSAVMKNFITPLIGEYAIEALGATTEAGIRAALDIDSRPILYDEAEGEGAFGAARMQSVLSLMRVSSTETNAKILKGSSGGGQSATSQQIRACFLFSSINQVASGRADTSRITIAELSASRRMQKDDFDDWLAQCSGFNSDYRKALMRTLAARLPLVLRNQQTFIAACKSFMPEPREGDQFGSLLGAAYALDSDELVTYDKALRIAKEATEESGELMDVQKDEESCLNYLITKEIECVTEQQVNRRWQIQELIGVCAGRRGGLQVFEADASRALANIGIRIFEEKWLAVSNTHPLIAERLKGTNWHGNWPRSLKRIAGAKAGAQPVRFNPAHNARATLIPLDQVFRPV